MGGHMPGCKGNSTRAGETYKYEVCVTLVLSVDLKKPLSTHVCEKDRGSSCIKMVQKSTRQTINTVCMQGRLGSRAVKIHEVMLCISSEDSFKLVCGAWLDLPVGVEV